MDIPGFKIERLIAEGGMASVYLAVQESLERRVALKVLKKFDSLEHSQRFLYEGRIIASLNHHNIITIHDIGVIADRHYIAMEYLEEGSLADRIERGMQLPDILDLVESIGGCLDFVHRREIVHRDVKPANILFHTDGTPKLTDFGIAKQLDGDQNLTMDGSAFGSPYYLSPEQAEGRPLDGRSDIYGLGIVFYEMLTGDKPYAEHSDVETIVAHLNQPIPVLPEAFSAYQDLLERMLAKAPEDRFASAGELVDRVRELSLSGQGSKARAATIRSGGPGSGHLAAAAAYAWRESPLDLKIALGMVAFSIAAGAILLQRGAGMQPEAAAEIAPASVADGTVESAASVTAVTALEPVSPDEWQLPQASVVENTQVSRSETEETTEQAAPAPESVPVAQELPEPADLAQSTPPRGPATGPDSPPPDKSDQTIDQWLKAADQALGEYRLTTPSEDNAYFYYQKVVGLTPAHEEARAGIELIADRYAAWARKELNRGNRQRARLYVQRGIGVQSDHSGLSTLRTELDKPARIRTLEPQTEEPYRTKGSGNIVKDFQKVWRSIFD